MELQGLILNAKVVGGTVIDVKSIIGGSGYNVGDVVSVSAAQLPGASSDFRNNYNSCRCLRSNVV